MECLWRRTLASVFLLLCLHNERVLCQNVQTGTRVSLPLLKEPVKNEVVLNPAPGQQQNNLLPPSNSNQAEFVPRVPYNTEYQRLQEYYGQTRPLTNTGQFPPGQRLDIPPINNFYQLQTLQSSGPACNAHPNTNIPQQAPPSLSINSPLPPNPTLITKIAPAQGLSPVSPVPNAQNTNFNLPIISNLPFSFQLNAPPVPLVPNLQNQIPCHQYSSESTLTAPSAPAQNQCQQILPLGINPYSQSFIPSNAQCTLSTDLTSVKFLPTPNIPSTIPTQNYVPIPQAPVQQVKYPQPVAPVDFVSNISYLPNYQVSTLPPVLPANSPPQYNCFRNPLPVTEEYTPVPINLQINVPAPTIPEPQITIITAYPQAPVAATTESDVSFGMYPPYPLPPIIIESRRPSSRSWLPLILIALIANDGYCDNGCCCCCPCACADTPIPYPIPIPTNNPIILGGARSRKNSSKVSTPVKTNSGN